MPTTLTNMGLTSWTSGSDLFNHTQLAANWAAVDVHDHSAGKGVQVPSGGLANGAVTNGKLAADAVDASKILDGSVGAAELGTNAVTTVKISDANVTTAKILDANVTTSKLADANVTAVKLADAARLGLTDPSNVRRGKSIILATGTINATTYGALSNGPDRVQSIVLPTDGLIAVMYQAKWALTGGTGTGPRAAIFLNSTQLKTQVLGSAIPGPQTQAAAESGSTFSPLFSFSGGLLSSGSSVDTADVTTGQVVGGAFAGAAGNLNQELGGNLYTLANGGAGNYIAGHGVCYIFAAAGTYDVAVQFKYSAGSGSTLSAKDRKLWVWTLGF